jgi:hypothetical protein
MKFAKTWDLMAFRGANEIVSPMISTAHTDEVDWPLDEQSSRLSTTIAALTT